MACVFVACSVLTSVDGLKPKTDAGLDVPDASCGNLNASCCATNQCFGSLLCTKGICSCPPTTLECGGACVDLQMDAKNCGTCKHDCLGGLCTGGVCQPSTLLTGELFVTRLTATPTSLIWTRVPASASNGGVYSARLDGANRVTLYDAGTLGCAGLAATPSDLYFSCAATIYHCSLPSCTPAPLATIGTTSVRHLALDTANARIVFAVPTLYNQQTGGFVGWVATSGGPFARLVSPDQPNPTRIAADSAGNAFWLNSGTYMTDMPQGNGGVGALVSGVSSMSADPGGVVDLAGFVVDGKTAFYGAPVIHEIHSVTSQGAPTTVTSMAGRATDLVADANFIYWTDGNLQGGIYRCEKNCLSPKLLAAETSPNVIAHDATSIYWATAAGAIRRLAK